MTDFIKKQLAVTPTYCRKILTRVDKLVAKNFFDEKVAKEVWPQAVKEKREAILASKDMIEFSHKMNELLKVLNTSHCGFYTHNDETFYFLRSLFGTLGSKTKQPAYDFTGLGIGGLKCLPNQIRYVLDGSPAHQAGLMVGDIIQKVNGRPYFGHVNFLGTAGTAIAIGVKRGSQRLVCYLIPEFKTPRAGYVDAISASAEMLTYSDCKVGYIHLWSGIGESEETFKNTVYQSLNDADGLIIDLRDGYGALGIEAVDFLTRPANGLKSFMNIARGGGKYNWRILYDQPVVALINGGSRSGKELVALQLQKTGRALLVGESTAGAVVGGRHYAIDKKTSLFLAIVDVTIDGERLEGVGVTPKIYVPSDYSKPGIDSQFDAAVELLRRKIKMNKINK